MIPRGEVGLILAGIGATLTLPNLQGVNEPVVGSPTFGAIVLMVIATTLITPPLLKWSLGRDSATDYTELVSKISAISGEKMRRQIR